MPSRRRSSRAGRGSVSGLLSQPHDQVAERAERRAPRAPAGGRVSSSRARPRAAGRARWRAAPAAPGCRADAARRVVEDAQERQRVARIAQHAQVGDQVLDLGALVEAHAADQRVGHLARAAAPPRASGSGRWCAPGPPSPRAWMALTQALERVAPPSAPRPPRRRPCRAPASRRRRRRSTGACRGGRLVVRHHRARGVEDGLGGAVVALQLAHHGAGEALLETQDVVELGAAPAVDALVLVAHRGEVAGLADQLAGSGAAGRGWCPGTRRPGGGADGRAPGRARSSWVRRSFTDLRDQVVEVDRGGLA